MATKNAKTNESVNTVKNENKKNILELLQNARASTSSLLLTSKGGNKESIYKKELFQGLTERECKTARRKIRNFVHAIFETIIVSNDKKVIAKLSQDFAEFYKNTYAINDYSFASIASENTKNKELINNALNIIKKELNIK